jgi:hypothetical protein
MLSELWTSGSNAKEHEKKRRAKIQEITKGYKAVPIHVASGYCVQYLTSRNTATPLGLQDHPDGQLPVMQLKEPTREYDPSGQSVQLFALGPENVPAEHRVAIPSAHLEPAGHGLQLRAPSPEKVVPPHGLQELESGPENVPPAHRVTTRPFEHLEPAGQGLQLLAPAPE